MYSTTIIIIPIFIVLDSHNEALGCSAAALNPETWKMALSSLRVDTSWASRHAYRL
jgi:hypothetical protein